MYNLEVISFNSFKQRVKLVKEYKKTRCKITIFDSYLLVEKFNLIRRDGAIYDIKS